MYHRIINIKYIYYFSRAKLQLHTAADMFLEVVLKREFPEFITTYLSQDHTFLNTHKGKRAKAVDEQVPHSKLWRVELVISV